MRIYTIKNIWNNEIMWSACPAINLNFIIYESAVHSDLFRIIFSHHTIGGNDKMGPNLKRKMRCSKTLVLVYYNTNYFVLLNFFVGVGHIDNFKKIVDDTDHTFEAIILYYERFGRKFCNAQNHQTVITLFSAMNVVLAYHFLLVEICDMYSKTTFLVLDDFGWYNTKHVLWLIRLIAEIVLHVILFMTVYNFTMHIYSNYVEKSESIYDTVKYCCMRSRHEFVKNEAMVYESAT